MCSNDVLKERIDNLIKSNINFTKDMKSFIKLQTIEHKEIFDKFEGLDDKYPTRRELKAVKRAGGIIIAIVGFLSTLGIISG